MTERFDLAIVGGGIVGLATAHRLLRAFPDRRVVLLEKEPAVGAHQTGHNSGVIHSGLYYRPGSAKARTCVVGGRLMKDFCRRHEVAFRITGKVVVATVPHELPALDELHRRGTANGVPGLALVAPERLREIEPHAAGLRALHVPEVAVVDYAEVARTLAALVERDGGVVRRGVRFVRARRHDGGLLLATSAGEVVAHRLIACAGLQSDRVARAEGDDPGTRIVPFRGEYYALVPERETLVRGLIYPVPDPRYPFLGVHFTRMVRGGVECGPNAVLAWAREGYRKRDVDLRDLAETLRYPGFWRMARRHWRMGWEEMVRSYSKRAFVRALQRLVPELRPDDVRPAGAGVRAQALARDGALVDDFLVVERERALHVLNAPSPAATASLAIADEIVARAQACFALGPRADA